MKSKDQVSLCICAVSDALKSVFYVKREEFLWQDTKVLYHAHKIKTVCSLKFVNTHVTHMFLKLLNLRWKSIDTATKFQGIQLNPKTTLTPFLFLPCSSFFPLLTPHPHPPAALTIDWFSVSVYVDSDPFRPLLFLSLSLDKPRCHANLLNTQPLQKCLVKAVEIGCLFMCMSIQQYSSKLNKTVNKIHTLS